MARDLAILGVLLFAVGVTGVIAVLHRLVVYDQMGVGTHCRLQVIGGPASLW